ncbi:hypothetical protein GCM10010254_73330 [Streptomyces chromofuscus]|nr:hypothetical protein GCM10010254_73330 [Streptomyces chromofuscus]
MVHMLRSVAETRPDSTAVECGKEQLTYRRLWEESGAVSARLRAMEGFRPGCLIGVLFERGVSGVVAQLGIWRAGAAYLPLDPALPDVRIRAVLRDAAPLTVLVQPDLDRDDVVSTGPLPEAPAEAGTDSGPADSPTAYVIYTSGSTGTPKGVEVGHDALANLLSWHRGAYATGPGVRLAAFAGLGFDASVWETWATLANGATLVLPTETMLADITAISAFLGEHDVEQCFLSTPLAEQLLAQQPPSSLRLLLTGGDRLRVHPPSDYPAAVHNHYGPTEATVVTTATQDLRTHGATGAAPVIGRPVDGALVRVVDDAGHTVTRPGSAGELLIGGAVLASGYRNDPELTARKFIRDDDGVRWYRSGDICRWSDAGELEFVERRDAQLSVRGHRVEAAEVEQAILSVRTVQQAAVAVREDGVGGSLVAFYCGGVDEHTVHAALEEQLPRYMVPSRIRRLDTIPLTPNGKIDRVALLGLPDEAGQPTASDLRGNSVDETVAGIWAELTGRRPESGDSFFEIGGHSLLAAKMVSQVRAAFGVRVELQSVFRYPVLSDFVAQVNASLKSES